MYVNPKMSVANPKFPMILKVEYIVKNKNKNNSQYLDLN